MCSSREPAHTHTQLGHTVPIRARDHPPAVAQGIARALLAACEEVARGAGLREASLHVREADSAARALYDRCGLDAWEVGRASTRGGDHVQRRVLLCSQGAGRLISCRLAADWLPPGCARNTLLLDLVSTQVLTYSPSSFSHNVQFRVHSRGQGLMVSG